MSDYEIETFKDKNGVEIKIGDTVLRYFNWRKYSDEGGKRLVSGGVVDIDRFILDNGEYIGESTEWVAYKVKYSGSCMVLEPYKCSSLEAISSNQKYSKEGALVHVDKSNVYMSALFKGCDYCVYNPSLLDFDCKDILKLKNNP